MSASLQEEFIKSKGAPVAWHGHTVAQIDRLPLTDAQVTVRFCSPPKDAPLQGVRLNAGKGGTITLSDSSTSQTLYVWHAVTLPPEATHRVHCANGTLIVCNIYGMEHRPGFVTEDCWTGNAGMEVLESTATMRRYRCSDGVGDFDPTDLEFEISWNAL